MKTQISRDSYKKEQRYSGVYQQQGRMLTDADWNNSVDLLRGALIEALQDVIGSGSPRVGAIGLNDDRSLQPGDLYVDGRRAVLPGSGPLKASAQPDLPGSPDLPATGQYIVYADVWDRSVTALEDSELRDAGLHGADTCTRAQTMVQIKTCPLTTNPETDIPAQGDALLTLTLHSTLEPSDPCDPCAGLVAADAGRTGNYLFRLEVHRVEGPAHNPTRLVLKWSSENGAEQYAVLSSDKMPPGFLGSRYLYEFFNPTTEKHPGVHLTQGFSPAAGIIKTAYEIPEGENDPKDFVRRWDGYGELVRAGSKWSLAAGWDQGVTLSTSVASTAPGYVSLGPGLSLNLNAIRLELELTGRTFVAGDFWPAPVREDIHGPGSELIVGAAPSGITHHYLKLGQVAADGTVQQYANDADRRRHSFPPLTDLRAPDVGYQTDCSSGLFNASHDNVKKALDRLCELAAEHVHYTANCPHGLYRNFVGTVQEALDRICAIRAEDINVTQPCDTGIYQGQTVTNLGEVLKLLCDIQADHVSYQPGSGCTFLDQPGISTVQDALDALCRRPGAGGCRVTVGPGGAYATIEKALNTLLGNKIYDICICLLAGAKPHVFGGTWQKIEGQDRFNLSIIGCGPGSKVSLQAPLRFLELNSLHLENFALEGSWETDFPLRVENCTESVISGLHHVGLTKERPLLLIGGGNHVRLENNILEAYTSAGLQKPQRAFEFDAGLGKISAAMVELFALLDRDRFFEAAANLAVELARLNREVRKAIVEAIDKNIAKMGADLTLDEQVSYEQLRLALAADTPDVDAVLAELREVRDQAHHAEAGIGIVFRDSLANLIMTDNTVFGGVSFYGFPGGDLDLEQLPAIQGFFTENGHLRGRGLTMRARGNHFSRLAVGQEMIAKLNELTSHTEGNLPEIYRTILLEGNTIALSQNQMVGENLTLTANTFESLQSAVGWAIGQTAILTGNRVRRTMVHNEPAGGGKMRIVAEDVAKAANLPVTSW